ncbi:MAG: hypothetical protein KKF46_08660 [Nanoarchaeota archaeon]|nr:hypothetical protein [Nanoarchaeota archaeon]MBU1322401.1 hypothetical protein [Nanoarchaeota archaeon]MBU1596924.1 hypothetical protein [Nanoarchaeota archaeon]MBU2442359.1 hypothetical protein [Nanoarchaeota archaeon]
MSAIKRKKVLQKQSPKLNPEPKKNGMEILLFAIILIVVLLSSIMVLRLTNDQPLFPLGESYYNLRISQSLSSDLSLNKDPVQDTIYEPNAFHYFLGLLLIIFSEQLVSLFLPILLGILSALLFFQILLLLKINKKRAGVTLIVLAVTPVFLILFSGLYVAGFMIFLSLLSMVLLLSKKKFWHWLGILSSILLVLTSLTGFIIFLLVLLFIFLALKRNIYTLIISLISSAVVVLLLSFFSNYTPRLLGFHSFAFRDILSVLRAGMGFDIFLIFLFLIGFVIIWSRSKETKLFHLVTVVFIVLSLFNSNARIFTSFAVCVYGMITITYFFKRKWALDVIKTGTVLLVLCSLVFSATNQISQLVSAQPDKTFHDSLNFLSGLEQNNVLTSETNGFLVEFYAHKRVLLDENSFLSKDYLVIQNVTAALFEAARLKEAEPLIQEHGIRYVLITPEMKEDLWEGKEQGLWFLVKHSDRFTKRYDWNDIEIWEYKRVGEI